MANILKQIGSTIDSIGKKTVKPLMNTAEDIMLQPFRTMETISGQFANNPMTYILIAGIIIIVINK